ncbi:MAG: two-component regulator propeller domain-containing protein [Chryseolinea sp.]
MRITSIFLILFALSHQTFGQIPFFQKINLPDKNEKVDINVLFQDRDGFIWLGTDDGPYKFDGFSFSHFTSQDSLLDNHVTAVTQDSIGRIWMGHSTGQLSYLEDGDLKMFTTPEGDAAKEISDILFDKNGVLWFSTLNDGLYYFKNNRLYRLDEENGIPDLYIYDLEEFPDGKIWAGTDRGIAICELKADKVEIQAVNQKQGLPDNIVRKIKFKNDKSIWLGTHDGGVIEYNPSEKKFTSVLKDWSYGTIADLILKEDQMWISSEQKGVMLIDSEHRVQKFATDGSAQALLIDREGGIWMGSKSVLMRTPGTEISFLEKLGSGIDQNIIAITVDHEDNIWFSNSDGLFKMNKKGNVYDVEKLNRFSFINSPVISLHTDSLGTIWAGTFGNGAWHLNTKGEVIHYFKNELRNGNILSICSKGSEIWFATLEGATQIKLKGNQFEIKNVGSKEGLSSDYIYQVFLDSKNRTWFATDGYDIDMLDHEGIHHFKLGEKPKVVYGFTEDGDHAIWANVQREGLYKFSQGKFAPVNKLRYNNLYSLGTNSFGNVVAVHDLGMEIFDVATNKIQFFGDEIGILNKKGNLNAISQSDSGEIFIGTESGIIQYKPASATIEESKPNPFIQKLKAGNKIFNTIDNVSLAYDDNDITINYLGFWYQNPQKLNYQYKLENFDRDWISSKNLEVTYSRLPPGQYTFLLRASDSDDFQNAKEVRIEFMIDRPFWQQIWFYILVAVFSISSIYLYIQYRERKLQREGHLLQLKVDERTKELQMRNEEIEAQSEELQAQSNEIQHMNEHLEELVKKRTEELEKKNAALEEYAFINAHKLRSPLASILGVVNLIDKLPQTPESQECVDHLKKSADALDEVVTSITRAIQKGNRNY